MASSIPEVDKSFVAKRHTYGEDCTSCRMVSGFGIIGMSIYVLTAAKKQKTNFSKNAIYCMSLGKRNFYFICFQ